MLLIQVSEENSKRSFTKTNIEVENKILAFSRVFSCLLSFYRSKPDTFRNHSQHYQNRLNGFRFFLCKDHRKSEQLRSIMCGEAGVEYVQEGDRKRI